VHLVFQDPYSALAPHLTVERIVAEAVRAAGHDVAPGRVVQALEDVGLVPAERYLGRRPDELSGGQRQRVALARATVRRPRLLVADEPTQMLDSTSGARLLGLMAQLRQRHGTAILLITHDLGLAGSVCDRLLVLDGGRIVESAAAAEVLTTPSSAQGQRLVGAAGRMRAALERHRDAGPGGP
jgi:peptide/nickel transport system ATP-binding protein